MMHGVRVRNVRRQDFWERSGAAGSAEVNTIIGSGIRLMQRRFRGEPAYRTKRWHEFRLPRPSSAPHSPAKTLCRERPLLRKPAIKKGRD